MNFLSVTKIRKESIQATFPIFAHFHFFPLYLSTSGTLISHFMMHIHTKEMKEEKINRSHYFKFNCIEVQSKSTNMEKF